MHKFIISDDRWVGFFLNGILDHLFQVLILSESKKDRLNVCSLNITKVCSIKLFLGKREFVSLNSSFLVIFHWAHRQDSILLVVSHFLAINVDSFFLVFHQVSFFDEAHQVLSPLCVNLVRVLDVIRKIHFWLVHVVEAHVVAFCQFSGFLCVQNIVWMRQNFDSGFFIA